MSDLAFTYDALPMRVVFGPGYLARLPDETDRLDLRRILVLSTPGQRGLAEQVASVLGHRAVGIFDRARMHVPVQTATEAAGVAADLGAGGRVAAGGGSTIGLAKALALQANLPFVAVPTTSSLACPPR
jgi:maleylacetate reductase